MLPSIHDRNGVPLMTAIRDHLAGLGFEVQSHERIVGRTNYAGGSVGFGVNPDEVPVFAKPTAAQKAELRKLSGGTTARLTKPMWTHSTHDPNKASFFVAFHGLTGGVKFDRTPEWGPKEVSHHKNKKLQDAFEALGFKVHLVMLSGWSNEAGDDYVYYRVVTDRPKHVFS